MAIQLYFSNQLEQLAEKFSEIICSANSQKANIFEPALVIVPNPNLVKWLQLLLAESQSVMMNIDFQYMESGMWNLLANLDQNDEKPEMLDQSLLQVLLLYGFLNQKENETDFEPFNKYLFGSNGGSTQDYAGRICQLSEKMAYLFQEYEFHRQEMIKIWRSNTGDLKGMELCQQKLYLKIKDLQKRLFGKTGRRFLSLKEYADALFFLKKNQIPEYNGSKKDVHFFGLSQIPSFHLQLIERLKDYFQIFIYALNPSKEFWEDIKTPKEKNWIKRKKATNFKIKHAEKVQSEFLSYEDNQLLSLWGRPGRESIRLLCELTDYDFNFCFTKENCPANLLQQIQKSIFTLSSGEIKTKGCTQDISLQIFASPSIYREVETVYNSILYNLKQQKSLRLTDIAVLVPDISKYKPVIDSVFMRKQKCISYNLIDPHAGTESLYGSAVLGILELAAGRFSRKEVFNLILNPCFMHKWKIDMDEIKIWAGWTEALNIFHTFDRKSKMIKGYRSSSQYTWKQGLLRLKLSRIMSDPKESEGGDLSAFKHFQKLVPFNDINTGNQDLLEKFCMIIETLQQAVNDLNKIHLSGKEWKQQFFNICDNIFEIPADLKGETSVLHKLIQAFENLKFYDLLCEDPSINNRGKRIKIELISEFVKSNLSSIPGSYGDYLTGGVTLSALQPARPIPFKIIYILGMEEGNFPGKADKSSLDLRLAKRLIGDISLPERNCYLFLEMLLSARHKFYISYISRDLQKDKSLQPCSLVNQLIRYIEQSIFSNNQKFKIAKIPLKGSSTRYLDKDDADNFSDVMVNYSISDRISCFRSNCLWKQVIEKASKDDLKIVESFSPDFTIPKNRSTEEIDCIEKIDLNHLKKFLEDPVTQSIKKDLDLFEEEGSIEEILLNEDEPFYSKFPVDYNLKIESIKLWLDMEFSSADSISEKLKPEMIYELFYDSFYRKGETPEGAFAVSDKNNLKNEIAGRIEAIISSILDQMKSSKNLCRAVFIGEQGDEYIPSINGLCVKYFDPVKLKVKTFNKNGKAVDRMVEICGQLPWVWKDRFSTDEKRWHALVLTGSSRKNAKEPDKYILKPVLFYLLSLASGQNFEWSSDSKITFHILYKESVKSWTYRFTAGKAVKYLERLVSDYLNQNRLEWMPFEIVKDSVIKARKLTGGRDDNYDKIDETYKDNFQIQLKEAYLQENAYLVKAVRPEIPENAFDKAWQRFQIFYQHLAE